MLRDIGATESRIQKGIHAATADAAVEMATSTAAAAAVAPSTLPTAKRSRKLARGMAGEVASGEPSPGESLQQQQRLNHKVFAELVRSVQSKITNCLRDSWTTTDDSSTVAKAAAWLPGGTVSIHGLLNVYVHARRLAATDKHGAAWNANSSRQQSLVSETWQLLSLAPCMAGRSIIGGGGGGGGRGGGSGGGGESAASSANSVPQAAACAFHRAVVGYAWHLIQHGFILRSSCDWLNLAQARVLVDVCEQLEWKLPTRSGAEQRPRSPALFQPGEFLEGLLCIPGMLCDMNVVARAMQVVVAAIRAYVHRFGASTATVHVVCEACSHVTSNDNNARNDGDRGQISWRPHVEVQVPCFLANVATWFGRRCSTSCYNGDAPATAAGTTATSLKTLFWRGVGTFCLSLIHI